LEWVLQTLLPPEKRAQIARELSGALELHRAEIMEALRPVIDASLPEALRVVEEELKVAVTERRKEWARLGGKYQREIVEQRLSPLAKQEIWPIVLTHVEPVANEVGREIWERASVWRFGWRSAYDRLLPQDRSLMRKEWSRFLKEDAMPVLHKHADDFVHAQQKILLDVASNQQVRAVLRDGLEHMLDDPELRQLVRQILQEVIIDNPRLRQVLSKHWTGPEAQRAFQVASERFEPAVVRIAELLFGSPEEGITPELSRVLRNKVLRKDRRWLVLETATPAQGHLQHVAEQTPGSFVLPVRSGGAGSVDPFEAGSFRRSHGARP
jgi:hypothetical protein